MGTLRFKISLIVSGVVTIILVVFGLIDVRRTSQYWTDRAKTDLRVTTERLASGLWAPVYDYNRTQIDRLVASEMQDRDILAVVVLDEYGKEQLAGRIRDGGKVRVLKPGEKIPGNLHERAPIIRTRESLGTVEVYFTEERILEQIRKLIRERLIQLVCLLVLVVVTLSVVLSRSILTPLIHMRTTFKAVASGDFDQEIDTSRNDEIGELASSFASLRDSIKQKIEELNAQVEERERAQKDLREIFDASSDAIFIHNGDGLVIDVNRAMCQMYECTVEDARTQPPPVFCSGEPGYTAADAAGWIRKAVEEGPQLFEWHARKMSGEAFWCEVALRSCEISGAPRILAVVRDISARKEAEAKLREKEEQLRQTQKMDSIGQLAGGVAHDFNNMLAGILSSAEILRMKLSKNDEAVRFVDLIEKSSLSAADLTQKLLTFSRKAMVKSVPVDMHQIIHNTLALLERTIDRKIELRVKLDAAEFIVIGDRSELQNALLNLGVNARDAMPSGGELLYATEVVELDADYCSHSAFALSPGKHILVRVRDTGTGMSKETCEHIFEPFFTTKGVGKGTGLGLAAVYGTVSEHCGEVQVNSEMGKGTEFRIYLPLSPEGETDAPKADEVVHGGGTVLLIDDEHVIRDVGAELLSYLGYTPMVAVDGVQGLELYREKQAEIDLVMLDLTMPKMNGREVFDKLKEENPEVKVLFCSGFSQDQNVDDLLAAGALGMLRKPFKRTDLSQAIAKALK